MSKKLFILPLFLFGAFLLTTTTSCGDKCKDKDCVSGTCLDGDCDCDAGYEVDDKGICNVEIRTKLLGKFSTTEQCDTDPSAFPYDITVTAGATVTDINIFNFFNSFETTAVKATISGDNAITIAAQTPVTGGDLEVSGSGTFETTAAGKVQMTLTYTVLDKVTLDKTICTGTVFVK